jgi:hypothetical protein
MKKQIAIVAALATACVSLLAFAPAAPAAPTSATLGNLTGTTPAGGSFTGTLSGAHFVNQGGVATLVGSLTGTYTSPTGATSDVTNQAISLPVTGAAADPCTILDLTLGPLHLDLLGLVVDLSPVHLQITAQQGSGTLLGNLLCAVAGLLDNTGTGGLSGLLQSITNLLNQILAQL